MTGPQCKVEGAGWVRDVQGRGFQCIMKISPLLISSADHSEVFKMEGEFQVKGRKRDIQYASTPHRCSFPLALISVRYLNGWIFIFFPYQLLFVDHVCIFTVCFWSGCS